MVRGAISQCQRGGFIKGHAFRQGRYGRRRHHHFFGVATPSTHGQHAVAQLEASHALAERSNGARHFAARRKWQGRLELIFVFNDERVGKVHRRRMHLHHHLPAAGQRGLHFFQGERLGRTVLAAKDGFHGLPLGGGCSANLRRTAGLRARIFR